MAKVIKTKIRGATVIVGKETRNGRTVWRLSANGRIKTVTTKPSSNSAMDEAVVKYGRALQRLANQ